MTTVGRKAASVVINSLLREKSGSINLNGKLIDFLYCLMRDHLPIGTVESLVREVEIDDACSQCKENEYSNGWLALYAKNLSNRLSDKKSNTELVKASKSLVEAASLIMPYVDDYDVEGINRLSNLRESIKIIEKLLSDYEIESL